MRRDEGNLTSTLTSGAAERNFPELLLLLLAHGAIFLIGPWNLYTFSGGKRCNIYIYNFSTYMASHIPQSVFLSCFTLFVTYFIPQLSIYFIYTWESFSVYIFFFFFIYILDHQPCVPGVLLSDDSQRTQRNATQRRQRATVIPINRREIAISMGCFHGTRHGRPLLRLYYKIYLLCLPCLLFLYVTAFHAKNNDVLYPKNLFFPLLLLRLRLSYPFFLLFLLFYIYIYILYQKRVFHEL